MPSIGRPSVYVRHDRLVRPSVLVEKQKKERKEKKRKSNPELCEWMDGYDVYIQTEIIDS